MSGDKAVALADLRAEVAIRLANLCGAEVPLARSAAGIFQSNLTDEGVRDDDLLGLAEITTEWRMHS